jgi:very-short-patch-repair endonuclease
MSLKNSKLTEEQKMLRYQRFLKKENRQRVKGSRYALAHAMQSRPTEAEAILLARIRKPDVGAWFQDQSVMCGYILDFYCKRYRIAVEVDGPVHRTLHARARDSARDRILTAANIKVLRFSNDEVTSNCEDVVTRIKAEFGWLKQRKASKEFSEMES